LLDDGGSEQFVIHVGATIDHYEPPDGRQVQTARVMTNNVETIEDPGSTPFAPVNRVMKPLRQKDANDQANRAGRNVSRRMSGDGRFFCAPILIRILFRAARTTCWTVP
jgi:hypothetical protein